MPADELPHTPSDASKAQPSSEQRFAELCWNGIGGGDGGGDGGGEGGGGDGGGGEGGGEGGGGDGGGGDRSEEHTSELQSPVPISYAVFGLKKKIEAIEPAIASHINRLTSEAGGNAPL